ncbi:MAG: ABC transporter permease [Bacillota bacterium]
MGAYVVRRIIQSVPLLIGITIITFGIMQLAPGNPLMMMVNPDTSPEDYLKVQEQLGMDRPLHIQYLRWLGQVLRGNLGYAVQSGRPVAELILERLPATITLSLSALAVSYTLSIPLGVISALRQHSVVDYCLTLFAFWGLSIPNFFFAVILVYIFSLRLNLLPTSGHMSIYEEFTGLAFVLDRVRYLILPVLALALGGMASNMRYTRSSMLDVLGEDYIRTARAKGLAGRVVIYKHALRNALLPIITVFGMTVPFLLGGSFIIETIFAWPGMGRLGVSAIFAREYPILMGLNLLTSSLVLFGNLLADVLYAFADPRIHYS